MKDAREALKGLLRSLGLEERSRGFQAAESWPEIAGPELARVSQVADFKDGRLVVEVRGSSAMQELLMRRGELVRAFADRYGAGLVRDIHLRPQGSARTGDAARR